MLRRILLVLMAAALAALSQAPQDGGGRGKEDKAAPPAAGRGGRGRGGPDPAIEKAKRIQPPQVMQLVRPGLYLVVNRGGNVLFRTTGEGAIVVDTKLPGDGNFERLIEILRGMSREPVKYVFNTHHHAEQTGNNAKFLALGAEVIAPLELKTAVDALEADPKPAPPNVTYRDVYAVEAGGVEARAHHFGPGHTGGDAVVHFPGDGVIALGGLLTVVRAPEIDYAGGGSALGWMASLDAALMLDWDVAVPANGPPQTREYVQTYRDKLAMLVDRARDAVRRGIPKEKLSAEIKTDDLGWDLQLSGEQLDGFYAEISGSR